MAKTLQPYICDGLLPTVGWRIPDPAELELVPHGNECVMFTQFLDRGFSLSVHPFLYDMLRYYQAKLHHLTPKGVAHLACFIALCENFLDTEPHWALFAHLFCAKPRTVAKDVLEICGGLGFETKKKSNYFDVKWAEMVKRWQSTWFYYIEPITAAGWVGCHLYSWCGRLA